MVRFEKDGVSYRILANDIFFQAGESLSKDFSIQIKKLFNMRSAFKKLPAGFDVKFPIPVVMTLIKAIEKDGEIDPKIVDFDVVSGKLIKWIAPIRSKPKRIYEGIKVPYKPEGDHAPYTIYKTLSNSNLADLVSQKISSFGKESGLFRALSIHSFGRGIRAPFEVMVDFEGAKLNISNVGYGVSQVLPLIVDFVTSENGSTFAVQQPEVHLHPKAQAALGGLIYDLADACSHTFIVETHSDYMIDRFRLLKRRGSCSFGAQVLYFSRGDSGNKVEPVTIKKNGQYQENQPQGFLDFFLDEEMSLLGI